MSPIHLLRSFFGILVSHPSFFSAGTCPSPSIAASYLLELSASASVLFGFVALPFLLSLMALLISCMVGRGLYIWRSVYSTSMF